MFFQAFSNFGFDGGFQMSFGIGAFPFGLFASTFNFGDPVVRGIYKWYILFND